MRLPEREQPGGEAGDGPPDRSHNMEGGSVRFEVRPFNRIAGLLGRSTGFPMCMPAGASIDDLLRHLNVKRSEVFLVFVNGRDITPDLNAPVRVDYSIQDDDVIALSGPVPYSWGYGSPVV